MDRVRSLFGGLAGPTTAPASLQRPSAPVPLADAARATALRSPCYDRQLVPSLDSDHIALLALVKRAATAAATDDAQTALRALHKFHSLLSDHLLQENTRLYLYIRSSPQARASGRAGLSRAFQIEMNQIARTVTQFVDQYTANQQAVLGPAFMVDLDSIRQTLAARFTREESTLYPMYAPSSLAM